MQVGKVSVGADSVSKRVCSGIKVQKRLEKEQRESAKKQKDLARGEFKNVAINCMHECIYTVLSSFIPTCVYRSPKH